ncbi:MAG: M20 family metallo-hydrolase [Fusobacterium sp. JB021]|nr:M20 family metallo-hydrolase [Fusobacterium sp. JB021]
MLEEKIYNTLDKLGEITIEGEGVTRISFTKEHKKANKFIGDIMKENGLEVREDNAGNMIGEYFSKNKNAKTLVIGSHQDSVKNGGKYDGPLGIILPIISFGEYLKEEKELPYNVKIISFGDEEGIRFAMPFISSSIIAGTFDHENLNRVGIYNKTLGEALKDFGGDPTRLNEDKIDDISDFLEIHIEQGPILFNENTSLGIVNAIQGFKRYEVNIFGEAGHSGTIPMDMRYDAGVGASEIVYKLNELIRKKEKIVATVGKMKFLPGSENVIPSKATFSIDIRSLSENLLISSMKEIEKLIQDVCKKLGLTYSLKIKTENKPTLCNENIISKLKDSFIENELHPRIISSGAGHDAQEMSKVTNIGMIFVRCEKGISHNPKESVSLSDINDCVKVLKSFFCRYFK